MAEVYRARAFGTAGFEKILVIKKVLPQMAEDKEFVEMFIDEARIAVQMQHVNLVQVFDLGEVAQVDSPAPSTNAPAAPAIPVAPAAAAAAPQSYTGISLDLGDDADEVDFTPASSKAA